MSDMQFKKYQHIERLGTPATEGILDGTVYVFDKLDGTNTSVYLNDSGEVEVASRNRALTPNTDDNHGVRAHILSDSRYKDYLAENPTHRLYGEWLVPHTVRAYLDDAWKQFYVFDVMDGERYLSYDEYKPVCAVHGILTIPPIARLSNPTFDEIAALQNECKFLVKSGCLGEGIVVKRYDFVNRFGETVWAKLVRPAAKVAVKMQKPIDAESVEAAIVERFLAPDLIEKEFAKLVSDTGCWDKKFIPKLLGVMWHTFITEETFNFLRHFKNPKVDFKLLNALVIQDIKSAKPELFA